MDELDEVRGMTSGVRTVIYPVKDVAKAKAIFSLVFGGEPQFDQPYYVGYRVDGQDIGLDPNGHAKGMTGPTPYFQVDDLDGLIQSLVNAGAELVQEATNVGGGRMIATLKDPDGNVIGLLHDS